MISDALRMATWLRDERGFSVLPVDHPSASCARDRRDVGKVPLGHMEWKVYQGRRATDEELGAWCGNGGDQHTFVVACRLVRNFALDRGDALDLLREWNQTCVPPWSERDLEAKIDGALKYGDGPIGSERDDHHDHPTAPAHFPKVGVRDGVPLTDVGAAERFAGVYGSRWRFDHRRGIWLPWTNHRWAPDTSGAVTRAALTLVRQEQVAALPIKDVQRKEAVVTLLPQCRPPSCRSCSITPTARSGIARNLAARLPSSASSTSWLPNDVYREARALTK